MYVALSHSNKSETFVVAVSRSKTVAIAAAKAEMADQWVTWTEVQTPGGTVVWEYVAEEAGA